MKDAKPRRQRTGSTGKSQIVEMEKNAHQNHLLRRHACDIQRRIFNLLWFFLTVSEHLWPEQTNFSFERRKRDFTFNIDNLNLAMTL